MRIASAIALGLIAVQTLAGQAVGGRLDAWTPGTFDIHQIHTGRGNSAFLIFPDGTTMLLDAGVVPDRKGLEIGPQRPDSTRSTGEWIAHYVRLFYPGDAGNQAPALDYAVVTHYHDDHMGALSKVASMVPIRKLIDRGEDPPPPAYPVVRDYFAFRKQFTGPIESLDVGRGDQIVRVRTGARSPDFEVRNVAGNGVVWTGKGTEAVSHFPEGWSKLPKPDQPGENDFSLAFLMRYGKFRYFTGGDLAGVVLDDAPAWRDLETPVARAVGPVDVAVLNHHGWLDSTNAYFLKTLQPRAVVIPAWHATHPDHSVLRRLRSPAWKPAPPDLFITTLLDAPRAVFSYLGESFRSTEGHIVIRVNPGGESWRVIILTADSETPVVKAVFGPFASRGQ